MSKKSDNSKWFWIGLIACAIFYSTCYGQSRVDNILNNYNSQVSSIVDGNHIWDPISGTSTPNGLIGTVALAPTIVNISNWTHSTIDFDNMWSGWGMPIPQQLSITREDGAIKNLLHTNTWDYGFNQSYTFYQIGAQTTFEHGVQPTYGMSSSGAITRPLPSNGW